MEASFEDTTKNTESNSLNEEIDWNEIEIETENEKKQKIDEKIICIENINNNRIYINYNSQWTIEEVN